MSNTEAGSEHEKQSTIGDLPDMLARHQDAYGHTHIPILQLLLITPITLVDEKQNPVEIPSGSILQKMHNYLYCQLPNGDRQLFDFTVDIMRQEVRYIELEPMRMEDERFPEIAVRIGLTRDQIMALAAILANPANGIGREIGRNSETYFDTEKREARQQELALTRQINTIFEDLFINGRRIEGTSTIGGKQFVVNKSCGSHGHVTFRILADDKLEVSFDNQCTGRNPTGSNKGWNGLRDWTFRLNHQFDRFYAGDREKYEQMFAGSKPLEVLHEALQNFQASDKDKELLAQID